MIVKVDRNGVERYSSPNNWLLRNESHEFPWPRAVRKCTMVVKTNGAMVDIG